MPFTPVETAIGAGLLLHASLSMLWNDGIVLGVSGFLRKPFRRLPALFLAGMVAGAFTQRSFGPPWPLLYAQRDLVSLAVGGLVTGLGTALAKCVHRTCDPA